jgi:hypothetical protein
MSLSERENALWNHLTETVDDPMVDLQPLRLQTYTVLETPAELWDLIEINRAQRKLTGEAISRALDFLGDILLSQNAKAVIAELPYEQSDEGLTVLLRFPSHGAERE